MNSTLDLRYPIGKFIPPEVVTSDQLQTWIDNIRSLPTRMQQAVAPLNATQLDTPYRPEGWTLRQVVHHVADSHINSYVRFHWTLTEESPTIKAYDEKGWAMLPDTDAPIELSLSIISAIHQRWVYLLERLEEKDWQRYFVHPATGYHWQLDLCTGMYAWHGNHHLAHITTTINRQGW